MACVPSAWRCRRRLSRRTDPPAPPFSPAPKPPSPRAPTSIVLRPCSHPALHPGRRQRPDSSQPHATRPASAHRLSVFCGATPRAMTRTQGPRRQRQAHSNFCCGFSPCPRTFRRSAPCRIWSGRPTPHRPAPPQAVGVWRFPWRCTSLRWPWRQRCAYRLRRRQWCRPPRRSRSRLSSRTLRTPNQPIRWPSQSKRRQPNWPKRRPAPPPSSQFWRQATRQRQLTHQRQSRRRRRRPPPPWNPWRSSRLRNRRPSMPRLSRRFRRVGHPRSDRPQNPPTRPNRLRPHWPPRPRNSRQARPRRRRRHL